MSLLRFRSPPSRNADADQNSLQSDRPPTYASSVTAAPTYIGRGGDDRVRAWSASVPPSASILSSPDTLLDETESSLADTVSVAGASSTATTGPRYSKRPSHTLVLDLYM
jgi:hypothetical protein